MKMSSKEKSQRQGKSFRRTVSIIIEDKQGRVLLQLRDDKPTILFPNCWTTIGGFIEPGEVPENALKRETMEELEYEFVDVKFLGKFDYNDAENFVFLTKGDFKLEDFILHEGQEIRFFSNEEIKKLKLAFKIRDVLEDYFRKRKNILS